MAALVQGRMRLGHARQSPVRSLRRARWAALRRQGVPEDSVFRLAVEEVRSLRSRSVTPSSGWCGRRYRPCAFTEQRVATLSSILRSERASRVNIEIMRAFVRLRQLLDSHAELARRLDELEEKYGAPFKVVFDALRPPVKAPHPPRRPSVVPEGR